MNVKKFLFLTTSLFIANNHLLAADSHRINRSIVHRIIGGNPAQPNAYHWMAALISKHDNTQYCGGSLIAENWVITACHSIGELQQKN
jgi:secreted trypsin-like serine protease